MSPSAMLCSAMLLVDGGEHTLFFHGVRLRKANKGLGRVLEITLLPTFQMSFSTRRPTNDATAANRVPRLCSHYCSYDLHEIKDSLALIIVNLLMRMWYLYARASCVHRNHVSHPHSPLPLDNAQQRLNRPALAQADSMSWSIAQSQRRCRSYKICVPRDLLDFGLGRLGL